MNSLIQFIEILVTFHILINIHKLFYKEELNIEKPKHNI